MMVAKGFIDLHLHSTASDGSLRPAELMAAAASAGVYAAALTDHDTTAGLDEASGAAVSLGVEFIAGVELGCSTEYGQVDILGYYVPLQCSEFESELAKLRLARDQRNAKILYKLEMLGMTIDAQDLGISGANALGRPHIAKLMVDKGYVKSVREAFGRFLGEGAAAYVPKTGFSPDEAVRFLFGLGAVPVIAHPMLIHAPQEWLEEQVAMLASHGLAGLEAYHSEHDARGVRGMVALADKHNLIVTGGSDFHGAAKPGIHIARGRGGLTVPETVLKNLAALRP